MVSKRSKRGFQSVNEKRHHLVEASQSGTLARQGFVSIIQMYLSRCTGHRSSKLYFDNFKDKPKKGQMVNGCRILAYAICMQLQGMALQLDK